jgi:hypothetical protein
MPSLRELQREFVASLATGDDARIGVYRNTVTANYRNALGATYRVVRELTGAAFFDAAVDAFVASHPSTSGDLNIYGGELATFLAAYPYARELPYLPDVARLEWAIDEANRAADGSDEREAMLARLSAHTPEELVFTLDPSCRLVHSQFPVMRIWQAHQDGGDFAIDWQAGADYLLVRREGDSPIIERLTAAEYAWLASLANGDDLATAAGHAFARDPTFDLGTILGKHIANRVVTGIAGGRD